MKRTIILCLSLAALFACQSPNIPEPQATLNCDPVTSQHPKADELQSLLDQYTSQHFVGMSVL
ncbi:MAG: hypothetical protein AAFP02_19155, partial [Bacteroidota bacterium]